MLFDEETGLIVRKEADGSIGWGDSCAETFRLYHLYKFRTYMGLTNYYSTNTESMFEMSSRFQKSLNSIKSPIPFRYQRAPSSKLPTAWGDPIRDFPSDQEIPLICALGAFGYGGVVQSIQAELGWRWQNGQVITPDSYGCFNRAQGKESNNFYDSFLWPTVLARTGYLPTWDSGLRKIRWGDPQDCADDLNLIHLFLQCELTSHTSTSKRAMQFYSKNRDIHKALQTYYSDEPKKYMLYAPVIERVFK